MKTDLILGGGGFIGGHLANRLKRDGYYVKICDIRNHEFFNHSDICHEFILGDLRDVNIVESVIDNSTDEVYQLAADMGGAGYLFTGENDANVMHNSAIINLNVAKVCVQKKVKRLFYASSACVYSEYNQLDPINPNCEESSVYPANPDSEYGWEKLFSERLYLSFMRNYDLDVRIARFHNIFGPMGTWKGGREKAPAAMCRKAIKLKEGDFIEVWGNGDQTRSFLYIDECIEAIIRFMGHDTFVGPVNIGSEEMVSINQLAEMALKIAGKHSVCQIKNITGNEFKEKHGFRCPIGVMGRTSHNRLYEEKMGWKPTQSLFDGMIKTFNWIYKNEK